LPKCCCIASFQREVLLQQHSAASTGLVLSARAVERWQHYALLGS
jgi:hypothetical protein